MIKTFHKIPVALPLAEIYRRLGRNRHQAVLSEEQQARLEDRMQDAFQSCAPCGCYEILALHANDGQVASAEGGVSFASESLCRMLEGSTRIALLAVTAGAEVTRRTDGKIQSGAGADALVYDATGSETADAAMDWLCDYLRRDLPRMGCRLTTQRFSPGYGDLTLQAQAVIFQQLNLASLGMQLTESRMLIPEKSVTAIAGVLPA